jgi:Big-like domain-containing protein
MNSRLAYAVFLLAITVCAWMLPQRASAQLGSLVVNITSPSNGATVSGTVTVRASVTVIGLLTVAGVQFRVDGVNLGGQDGSSPYTATWNTTASSNGSHTLVAVARTTLGLTFTSNPVTVTVNNAPPPDTTPPNVTIASPANGATVSGTITISANASDNVGVAGVRFHLDGASLGAEDTSAPYAGSWNTAGVANGSHTLTAIARDAAGNTRTSVPVTVTVNNAPSPDTTPPTVSLSSPANGATVSGTITVTANASDNVGVAGVQFFLDSLDNPLGPEDTSAPYQVSWNTAAVSNGQHVIAAVARDTAGNRTTSAAVSVTVSNGGGGGTTRFEESSPAVSANPAGAWVVRGAEVAAFSGGVAGSSDAPGATVTFTFTGTAVSWIGLRCNICGIANVSIDDAAPTAVDTAGPAAPGSPGLASASVFAVSGLAAGSHTLVITVTGNTSSSAAHVIVDAFDVSGTGASPATRIEDTDPAVSYAGTWIRLNDPRGTNGTGSESRTAGDRATLSFTGTGVRWVSFGNSNNGIARVLLDGALVGEVDTFRPAEQPQIEVFSASGLTRGPHTLVMEVTGRANPASTDVWVIVDAFDVTP